MRIAFLTEQLISNEEELQRSFSGITYGMISELSRRGHEVQVIAAINPGVRGVVARAALSAVGRTVYRGQNMKTVYHPLVLDGYAACAQRRLRGHEFDLLFTHSTLIAARLRTSTPIVIWRGAHYAALKPGYRGYQNLPRIVDTWANHQEVEAMSRAAMNIFAAKSACNGAHAIYGIPHNKLKVIPYGANLHPAPNSAAVVCNIAGKPTNGRLNFLFFGVDWYRKGGDRVITALNRLAASGRQVHLDIVGISQAPTEMAAGFSIQVHGYLDKAIPEQFRLMNEILKRTHFLVHPARGEAFGVVLCEAFACGIPVAVTPVDGLPTIVDDGINGVVIDEPFDADQFTTRMLRIFDTAGAYETMAENALRKYERRLNWQTAIEEFLAIVEPLTTTNQLSKTGETETRLRVPSGK